MADQCDWCKRRFERGQSSYPFTFNQEFLNEMFARYNRGNANDKALIWERLRRGNEWPKAGDKRGAFCSPKCGVEGFHSGITGEWHSRGWFG